MSLILIPRFGTIGAAGTAMISVLLYNAYSVAFIYLAWGIKPKYIHLFKLIMIGATVAALAWFLPDPSHPILAMAVRSIFFGIAYAACIFSLSLAPDLQAMAMEKWQKLRNT